MGDSMSWGYEQERLREEAEQETKRKIAELCIEYDFVLTVAEIKPYRALLKTGSQPYIAEICGALALRLEQGFPSQDARDVLYEAALRGYGSLPEGVEKSWYSLLYHAVNTNQAKDVAKYLLAPIARQHELRRQEYEAMAAELDAIFERHGLKIDVRSSLQNRVFMLNMMEEDMRDLLSFFRTRVK